MIFATINVPIAIKKKCESSTSGEIKPIFFLDFIRKIKHCNDLFAAITPHKCINTFFFLMAV